MSCTHIIHPLLSYMHDYYAVAPSEPTNITIESFGPTWILLSWLGPTLLGTPEFSLFMVTAEPANPAGVQSQLVIVKVDSNALETNITDLFPGQEYVLSVMAVSEANGMRASSDSSVMVFVITNTSGNYYIQYLILAVP